MHRLKWCAVVCAAILSIGMPAYGQSGGGVLNASSFNAWTLPQGNSPAVGSITWAAPTCTVTSDGYSFVAPKVGRPITIIDSNRSHSETVIPTSVVITGGTCTMSAVMQYTHYTYYLESGTYGLQEALDYNASQPPSVVTVGPTWQRSGGTTSMLTGATGNATTSIMDQRTGVFTPYVWNATTSQFAEQPYGASAGGVPTQLQLNAGGELGGANVYQDATGSLNFTRAASFQGGPRFGAFGYIASGDSITYGTGVTDTANSYAAQLSRAIGGTYSNVAIGGYQSEDWAVKEIFPDLNPTPEHNPIVTALILHNDLHWCSTQQGGTNGDTPNCIANAQSSMLAGLTWATIPITQKQLGDAPASSTGTWATDTTVNANGYISSTSGSTATYAVTTTIANQPVYIWWKGIDGNGGTASFTIDGGSAHALTTASPNAQCICTIAGYNDTVWGSRYVISSVGSHALVFTVTSATSSSNTFTILGVGTPTQGPPPIIAPPSIFIMSPIYENNFANEQATNDYTTMLSSLAAELDGDGLLVVYRDTHPYMNVAQDMSGNNVTVPMGTGDNNSGTVCSAVPSANVGQHPNICGHTHIAEAFLSMIQPAPIPSTTVTYPENPANLDGLTSLSSGSVQTPIIGGLNDYGGGSSAPGYAFGRALGYFAANTLPTNNGVITTASFANYGYSPNNTLGTYYGCTYAAGTSVTLASFLGTGGFTGGCGAYIPNASSGTNSGGGFQLMRSDQLNQFMSVPNPASNFTGYQYPVVQGPGNANYANGNFSSLENHYTSGNLDFECLTLNGAGAGAVRPICALPSGLALASNGLSFQGSGAGPKLTSVASGAIPSSCVDGSIVTLNNNNTTTNNSMAICINGTYQTIAGIAQSNAWSGTNTFTTQPSTDSSANAATTAYVHSVAPLVGTTAAVGGSALGANACSSATVAVTGATVGMVVDVSPVTDPNPSGSQDYDWYGLVSPGGGTVKVNVCAIVAGTPAATAYNVRVIQ